MKKIIAMLVALMVTLFTVNVLAYTSPPSPAPASWISDSSRVLSDEAHARFDAKLRQINQSSANEIAALILPTLDDADIADVGDITVKTWGVGKKGLDNGVLVVLAMKEKKSRISTGKGVEGDLPDLKSNDILVAAQPYLRKGDVEGVLRFIFDSSASAIANHKAEVAAGKTTESGNRQSCDVSGGVGASGEGTWVLVLVVGGAIALVWYLAARTKRRRQTEEAERVAAKQRLEARKRLVEEREAARKRDEERKRKESLTKNTPVVSVPTVHRPTPTVPRPTPRASTPAPSVVPTAIAASAALAAAEDSARKHRAEEDRKRQQREQEDADRRRRQQEDDDRRRRDSESSSSYSSSYSSSNSGWDSGGSSGGFGGGDSGGGGSSGDW
jgi:uncharacterized membrane protein YgcG